MFFRRRQPYIHLSISVYDYMNIFLFYENEKIIYYVEISARINFVLISFWVFFQDIPGIGFWKYFKVLLLKFSGEIFVGQKGEYVLRLNDRVSQLTKGMSQARSDEHSSGRCKW